MRLIALSVAVGALAVACGEKKADTQTPAAAAA